MFPNRSGVGKTFPALAAAICRLLNIETVEVGMKPLMTLAAFVAVLGGAPVAEAQQRPDPDSLTAAGDGPYVSAARNRGWLSRGVSSDLSLIEQAVPQRGAITVAQVGDVPAFVVPLRPLVRTPAPDTLPLDPDARLMVLADTHGEYEIVVEFLRRQGVIGADLHWTFGDGQMVVTGDMLDRGPHQIEILWLLYKLEAEAKAAGGALHVLMGNHEMMNLRGDLRYIHPRYAETARILGAASYADLFTAETVLGDWLRSRPSVMKLGDLLLLHGGVSPQVLDAKLTVEDMNAGIRRSLDTPLARRDELDPVTALIAGTFGPLWFRGYFPDHARTDRPYTPRSEVDRSLEFHGVRRILVGHTVMDAVTPLYGGRVIAVQVYPEWEERTGRPILEGALREGGRWFGVNAQGERRMLTLDD